MKINNLKRFNILAVEPLKGCDGKYLKALTAGQKYDFFLEKKQDESEYEFDFSIYDTKNLAINISAIVGKNGSGKSSLIDLIYMFNYNLSILFSTNDEISKYSLLEKFNCSLYYLIENSVYKLEFKNKKFKYFIKEQNQFKDITKRFSLENYFYSVAINYSLYGLNDKYDKWLEPLFHKNDGYKTPLVINPYRIEGNIKVNSELHLAQTRTILNLATIKEENPEIVNGKKISLVEFTMDIINNNKLHYKEGNLDFDVQLRLNNLLHRNSMLDFFLDLSKSVCGVNYSKVEVSFLKSVWIYSHTSELISKVKASMFDSSRLKQHRVIYEMIKYSLKKLFKICIQQRNEYGEYIQEVKKGDDKFSHLTLIKLPNLYKDLSFDKSHSTLKLRQIIYTIKSGLFSNADWIDIREKKNNSRDLIYQTKISWKDVQKKVAYLEKKYEKRLEDRLEIIPNAFLKPEIFIKNETGEDYSFQNLSSGEQQLSNTLQTVFYHIYNINSVHKAYTFDRKKYSNVNIIFDEIELYFHPELQSKFIKELIHLLKRMKTDNISGINILFSTHSPFILSDIPAKNILRLHKGKPDNRTPQQSFGANIHNLLANEFFLEEGYMGKYAKDKIEETIKWIRKNSSHPTDVSYDELTYYKKVISIVDEPVIRIKLSEMIDELSMKSNRFQKQMIQKEIDFLTKKRDDLL